MPPETRAKTAKASSTSLSTQGNSKGKAPVYSDQDSDSETTSISDDESDYQPETVESEHESESEADPEESEHESEYDSDPEVSEDQSPLPLIPDFDPSMGLDDFLDNDNDAIPGPSTAEPAPQPRAQRAKVNKKASPNNPSPDFEIDGNPERTRVRYTSNKTFYKNGLDWSLPPIFDIEEIFDDMAAKAMNHGLDTVLEYLETRDRPLRVVTMCSGTESPLLALQMINNSLERSIGRTIPFEHLFSAEIVPFKQAYIERNFQPPILFRDVCELDQEEATTAYGAKVKIPVEPELLIAGFSCVDFSMLNSKKKTLEDGGESAKTLFAILKYINLHRPFMVVLENVSGCPWAKLTKEFANIGYDAKHKIVDTKHYYLPQTRERGYMFCIDKTRVPTGSIIADRCIQRFLTLKRPASSPFSKFTLENDDLRVLQSQLISAQTSFTRKSANEWVRYLIRHHNYRVLTGLGFERPLTHWEDGGTCRPPDWADKFWLAGQVERVWDTLDMNYLRKFLEEGYDFCYKLRVVDVSQGIDRETDTRPWGIAGCITPSGMPYVSTRGGLLSGLECLALQGLPVNRLSLTRESSNNLQDLAGNAMSSTVVGSAIISALLVGFGTIKPELRLPSQHTVRTDHINTPKLTGPRERDDCLMISRSLASILLPSEKWSIVQLLRAHALLGSRLCVCEGQTGILTSGVFKCTTCGHTSCGACYGNPTHKYVEIPLHRLQERRHPSYFDDRLKWNLPVCLSLNGMPEAIYREMQANDRLQDKTQMNAWDTFIEGVKPVFEDTLYFSSLKRERDWTAFYEGACAKLHFVVGSQGVTWYLYAKPPSTDPPGNMRNELFLQPIARMKVGDHAESLLNGVWEVCAPLSENTELFLTGTGKQVPSIEARIGLENEMQNRKVWTSISVDASDQAVRGLDVDIRGVYDMLPNCVAAADSLHKRRSRSNRRAVYFFLDPRKLGPPETDTFVFSLDHTRMEGDVSRRTILELNCTWRQFKQTSERTRVKGYYRVWSLCPELCLTNADGRMKMVGNVLSPIQGLKVGTDDCCNPTTQLLHVLAYPARDNLPWKKGPWRKLGTTRSSVLNKFSLYWARFSNMTTFDGWRTLEDVQHVICQSCAPRRPHMMWEVHKVVDKTRKNTSTRKKKPGEKDKTIIIPREDPKDAARFELEFKQRPTPFTIWCRIDEKDIGHVCFEVNILTLIHRACAMIGKRIPEGQSIQAFWRLRLKNADTGDFYLQPFRVTNNKLDPLAAQPPNFRFQLRDDQARSLHWALLCESDDAPRFRIQEAIEVTQEVIGWRLEAKVCSEVIARGGFMAMQPGYGKTPTALAIIDAQYPSAKWHAMEICIGFIRILATLIISPYHLNLQWTGEIVKFLGSHYKVLRIDDAAALERLTVEDFQEADIIVASASIFEGDKYYTRLQNFTGGPAVPKLRSGRMFEEWLEETLQSVASQVESLKTSSSLTAKGKGKQKHGPKLSLHAFRFERLICDEYHHHVNSDVLALLSTVNARSRWFLSGTPPLDGFRDINKHAKLLNVYLGVDDETRGAGAQTDAELFQSYRKVESSDWHRRRHAVAQSFLDRFMRQNIAEIPPIPTVVHYHAVHLSAVEIALYYELKIFFESCNIKTRPSQSKLNSSDYMRRVNQYLEPAASFEEALVRGCTYFDVQPNWVEGGKFVDTISKVIECRELDIKALVTESLANEIGKAVWLLNNGGLPVTFIELEVSLSRHDIGDEDISTRMLSVLRTVVQKYQPNNWTWWWSKPGSNDNDDKKPNLPSAANRTKALNDLVSEIRTSISELVRQSRAVRFMEVALSFQVNDEVPNCYHCGCQNGRRGIHNMLGKCGHVICNECVEAVLESEKCPVRHCRAATKPAYIINGQYFGNHKEQQPVWNMGGTKMRELATLLQDTTRIPADDQVILFVQYKDYMKITEKALRSEGISVTAVGEGENEKSVHRKLQEFTSPKSKSKVLMLQLGSEVAAGLNLQMANHVIFIAEMTAPSDYEYQTSRGQAMGRVIRYGQQKTVHIWNILALNTMDVGVLQAHNSGILIRRPNGEFDFVRNKYVTPDDVAGWELPAFTKRA